MENDGQAARPATETTTPMFTFARTATRWAGRHAIPAAAATAIVLGAAGGGIGYAISGQHATASAASPATSSPLGGGRVRAGAAAPAARAEQLMQRALGLLAKETGRTVAAVRSQLQAGLSVDQIADAKAPAIESAILTQIKKVADRAVTAGRITATQETAGLAAVKSKVDALMAEPGTQLLKDAQGLIQGIQGIQGRHGPKTGAPAAAAPSPAA